MKIPMTAPAVSMITKRLIQVDRLVALRVFTHWHHHRGEPDDHTRDD